MLRSFTCQEVEMDNDPGFEPETNWALAEELKPEFMLDLYTRGVIGTKEFRSWLGKVSPTFSEVRDADVDNEIDRLARERAQEIREEQEEARRLGND